MDEDTHIVVSGFVVRDVALHRGHPDPRRVVVKQVAAHDELIRRVHVDAITELAADLEGRVVIDGQAEAPQEEAIVLIGARVAGRAVGLVPRERGVARVRLHEEADVSIVEGCRVGHHQAIGVDGAEPALGAGE